MRDLDEHGDSHQPQGDDDADGDVRKLMMIANKRWELPAEARARVYAATLETFEAIPEPATPVQAPPGVNDTGYTWRFALAATCLLTLGAALLFFLRDPYSASTPGTSVARVIFSAGDTWVDNQRLRASDDLASNAELSTGADGLLQVRLSSGVELRVDSNTRLQVTTDAELRLLYGRIYFDSADGGRVRVRTVMGNVADIGTQFVVEINQTQLNVIVREGAVQVEQGANTEVARAQPGNGERLSFSERGLLSRAAMSTTDPYWQWIGFANTAYKLDSGSLDDYLQKSAHECGLQLSYSDASSQQAAQKIRPYGTTTLSGCLVAIDEVLVTNRLQRVSADDGYQLVIDFDKGE